MQKTVHVIAGPTASGKSAYGLQLAQSVGGEVINADSIQLYQDLPILTARPTHADMQDVPHHLYGLLKATEKLSAAKWRGLALEAIHNVLEHHKTPVIIGGTGFYIKALIEGLSPIPDIPDDIREQVIRLQENIGTKALHALLKEKDPVMGVRLNANDTQRVMRAYEVLQATGKSLSYFQSLPPTLPPDDLNFKVTLLMPERENLYARCDKRFHTMIECGALREVENFLACNIARDAPVTRALGFGPLKLHLEGVLTQPEAIKAACLETRHYAKRQVTWFKNQLQAS